VIKQWHLQIYQKVSIAHLIKYTVELIPENSDSLLEASDPSGMLDVLNGDIDDYQMPSDEELSGDDDPELLAEIERR